MNVEFRKFYDNVSLLFEKITENAEDDNDLEYVAKGKTLLDIICYYDKDVRYEDVLKLEEIIRTLLERMKTGYPVDDEKRKERIEEEFSNFKKRLNEIANKINILPLTVEQRQETLKWYRNTLDHIDSGDFDNSTKQSLYSSLSFLAYLMKTRFSGNSIRDRCKIDKIIKRIEGKCDKVNLGEKPSSKIVDPNALALIAEIIVSIPELWEGEHYRKIAIENVFLNQVYRGLSGGLSEKEAIEQTISEVKNEEIVKYLKELVSSIRRAGIIASSFCRTEKGLDNDLAFFQKEAAYRFINNEKNFLFLFDDPGTRKTITSALSMISKMMQDGMTEGRILVICPNCVRSNWIDEIKNRIKNTVACVTDIHEDLNLGKIIIGKFHFEIVGTSLFEGDRFKELDFNSYDGIIVDEAHNFKQREAIREKRIHSKRSNNLSNIIGKMKYRIIQTGTPVVNEPYEYATIINNFSGEEEEVIPIDRVKAIPLRIEQGCYIYIESSKYVVRRHKKDVLDLPEMRVIEVPVNIGKKGLMKWRRFRDSNNHIAKIAQYEATLKIGKTNEIIKNHFFEKGVVFSYYIGTNSGISPEEVEWGILREYYDRSPCPKKIYIAGDGIRDIDGNPLPYNDKNADLVRKQFRDCKAPAVAYVSMGTCREGINEFSCANYAVHIILPFEPASLDQAITRLYRQGREYVDCTIYIPIIHFVQPDGNPYYKKSDNQKVFSLDESLLRLIKSKKQLMHITCDGVRKKIDDSLIDWNLPEGEDKIKYMMKFAEGENYITKPNISWHVANFIDSIASLQDRDEIINKIKIFDDTMRNTVDDEFEGFFSAMSNFRSSVITKKQCKKIYKKMFGKKGINIIHVGSGACQWDNEFPGCKMTKFDYIYDADDVVFCDRSELEGLKEESTDFILATHLMHWNANEENQSLTMDRFNEVLVDGGIALFTCPSSYRYPFIEGKGVLKNKGFELVEEFGYGNNRGYVIKKTHGANITKGYSHRHLPKMVKK